MALANSKIRRFASPSLVSGTTPYPITVTPAASISRLRSASFPRVGVQRHMVRCRTPSSAGRAPWSRPGPSCTSALPVVQVSPKGVALKAHLEWMIRLLRLSRAGALGRVTVRQRHGPHRRTPRGQDAARVQIRGFPMDDIGETPPRCVPAAAVGTSESMRVTMILTDSGMRSVSRLHAKGRRAFGVRSPVGDRALLLRGYLNQAAGSSTRSPEPESRAGGGMAP